MAARKTIAVVYATKGGMGDVGKFAIAHALKAACEVRPVALSCESTEGTDLGIDSVDVTDKSIKEQLQHDLRDVTIDRYDIEDDSTQAKLETVFDGIDAVVCCVGNRQPSMPRWCERGVRCVLAAMMAKQVPRIVLLSSMGIGEDFMPRSFIRSLLWPALLHTLLRSARKDLTDMENAVRESGADYVLVRAVGLTPAEPPKGSWKLLTSNKENTLMISVAKSDVASFMVQEALSQTLSKTAVTIGQPPERKGPAQS